jgi:hypothetical protein
MQGHGACAGDGEVFGFHRLSAVHTEPLDRVPALLKGDAEVAALGLERQVLDARLGRANPVEARSGRGSISSNRIRSAYRAVSPIANRAGSNRSNDIGPPAFGSGGFTPPINPKSIRIGSSGHRHPSMAHDRFIDVHR